VARSKPAAFCGVVGIKPTYGLVSRYGLVAYANSLEQIGPIAPTVEEAAELLEVVAGPDPNDATTEDATEHDTDYDFAAAADGDVDGLSIGVPTELVEPADEEVTDSFWSAIDDLESQGASYHDVDLPSVEHAVEAYYVIAMSEASSNLARFDGVRYGYSSDSDGNWNEAFAETREEGFGEEVKRRVVLGRTLSRRATTTSTTNRPRTPRAWVKQDFDESLSDAGRAGRADDARPAHGAGREPGRPDGAVPRRRQHDAGEPRRLARHLGPYRGDQRRPPGRDAVRRAGVRREGDNSSR